MKNNIKIGDKVIYNQGNRAIRCKVLDFKMSPWFHGMLAEVEFEDTDLIPRVMDVDLDHLSPMDQVYIFNTTKCCCGLKHVRDGGRHSSWCEIKNEE